MKTIEQLGASPAPWSLNLETCTVVDVNGRPVLDNEFGVASMEDADLDLFIGSAGLYECLREAVIEKCRPCIGNRLLEWHHCGHVGCPYHKWRDALDKAQGKVADNGK